MNIFYRAVYNYRKKIYTISKKKFNTLPNKPPNNDIRIMLLGGSFIISLVYQKFK